MNDFITDDFVKTHPRGFIGNGKIIGSKKGIGFNGSNFPVNVEDAVKMWVKPVVHESRAGNAN